MWLQMMMSPIKGNLNLERGNDSGLPRTLSGVERLHSMTLERLPACAWCATPMLPKAAAFKEEQY